MAIWVGMVFGGVQQERIQFNEKTLWTGGPSSTSEYTYGNRDGAASHLGSIREKLSKGDKSGLKGNLRNFSQVSKRLWFLSKFWGHILRF
ncbi:glycoside hydrolase N-terminal domain-containing protein [Bacillus cereus]